MEPTARDFLVELLETPSPSGYETRGQRVWLEYVDRFADDVRTDAYGNAIAVHEGDPGAPEVVLTGHADEIGFIVRSIDENGFVRPGRIGGSDPSVSRGQHVTVHAADGPVDGVIGQTAIHLREEGGDEPEISDLWIDIGAESEEEANERLGIGDPITVSSTVSWLSETRLAARGLDNRVGTWAAAEGFRRAVQEGTEATVYAVSTVQEEVGVKGAQMVGFDLEPDAVVVDVGHAVDYPSAPEEKTSRMELGDGPALGRGSTNHPAIFEALRSVADDRDVDVQIEALGLGTGTDADGFFTAAGAIPSQVVSVPNRYMHTPVELIDTDDLEDVATVIGGFAREAHEFAPFTVEM